MNFNSIQIPPPKYWQEFEDLCLAVFKRVWSNATATKNGRSGQQQRGTDISGKPRDSKGIHGVQCKDKDTILGSEVTKAEFDSEIAKAENFKPALAHWILATTASKDAKMEEYARVRSAERERDGKFGVQILFWEDLQSLIASHPDVIEEFFPDQSPRTLRLMERLEGKATPEAVAKAHAQASDEIAQFVHQHAVDNPIQLTIEELTEGEPTPSSQDDVAKALLAGDAIVLEAAPGAGKTTSLLQVATLLARLSQNSAPLIVPLAEQLDTKAPLGKQIFERARLAPIGADMLNGLALEGHFTFLCDGWNERSFDERAWLQKEFRRLRRDYPTCGLLVTTRLLSPLSIPEAKTLTLKALTFEQQRAILRDHNPETAEALLMGARRNEGLRSIIRNPFYLNALSVIAPDGKLPDTKEEVLSEFVRAHDEHPEHRDELYKVLLNNHRYYLCRLAALMAQQGASSLRKLDASAVIRDVSSELVAAGTIEERCRPTLDGALDTLVAHHLLVVLSTTGAERVFGFQHQQILEWFASFWLDATVLRSQENGDAAQCMTEFVNRSDSDEVVFFAVERLGKGDKAQRDALAAFILKTFHLDVMLAADLIRRSPDAIWAQIAGEIGRRVSELSKSHMDQAVRFMGRTGRPEFAGRIWDAIKDEKRYDSLAGLTRGWLLPTSLGPDGIKRVSSLAPDFIRSIAWDFCVYAGEEGLEFAKALALRTEIPEAALTVLDHLEFEGADEEADGLIGKMPAKLWDAVVIKIPLRRARANIRERVIKAKQANAEKLTGADLYHALRELVDAGVEVDRAVFVSLVLTTNFKEYYIARDAIEFVATKFPKEFQAAAVAALKAGQELPPYASDYIKPEPEAQDALFGAFQRQTKTSRRESQIAKTLTGSSVSRLFDELDVIGAEIEKADRKDATGFYQARSNLVDAICSVSAPEVIDALLAREVTNPAQVNDLSEVLFRLKTNTRDEDDLPVAPELKAALVEKLEGWARFFEKLSSTRRYYPSHYATALGKVPHPDLLPSFMTALNYELHECEIDRAEREEWQRAKKKPDGDRDRTGYYMIYRNALTKFGGENTKTVLLSFLDNATFGESAAFELIRFGSSKPQEKGFRTGPSFEQIVSSRAAPADKLNPVASAVLKRIDELLATGKPEDAASATKFATAAVQMDFGSDAGPIFRAAEKAPAVEARHNLLAAMLVFGLEVPPEWIAAGHESARKLYFEQRWQNPNEWWVVRRWLELLGASDNPVAVLGYVDQLPAAYKNLRQLREIGRAIGFSPSSKATSALIALSKAIPEFVSDHDWQRALLRQDKEEGAAYLLELLLNDTGTLLKGAHHFSGPQVIAEMFLKHAKIKAAYFERLKGKECRPTPLMAEVVRLSVSPSEICDLIVAPASHQGPLRDALIRGASEFAMKRVPIEGSNSYEEYPDDLTELRKNLFALAHTKGPQAKLAYRILLSIEGQRERYGRPPTEPRHPDVGSGKSWPMSEPEG
jgi:hypothetical protein